jgi:hypothetical protein
LFKRKYSYWRLVLIARKFSFAGVAIMFSSSPSFQAW